LCFDELGVFLGRFFVELTDFFGELGVARGHILAELGDFRGHITFELPDELSFVQNFPVYDIDESEWNTNLSHQHNNEKALNQIQPCCCIFILCIVIPE
jgi:hypothetical protein